MTDDPLFRDPEKLAIFVQEYVRHEGADDCNVISVIRADLRDPRYHPATIAERLLAKPEIQAAIQVLKAVYKPAQVRDVSQQSLSDDAESLYQRCLDERQYQPALAAKRFQAELHSIIKKDAPVVINNNLTLTDAQLEKIAKSAPIDGEFKTVVGTGISVVS